MILMIEISQGNICYSPRRAHVCHVEAGRSASSQTTVFTCKDMWCSTRSHECMRAREKGSHRNHVERVSQLLFQSLIKILRQKKGFILTQVQGDSSPHPWSWNRGRRTCCALPFLMYVLQDPSQGGRPPTVGASSHLSKPCQDNAAQV